MSNDHGESDISSEKRFGEEAVRGFASRTKLNAESPRRFLREILTMSRWGQRVGDGFEGGKV